MAIATEIDSVDLSTTARRIETDQEAIQIANKLSGIFQAEASLRDENRILPTSEIESFSRSGLWAITIPKKRNGSFGRCARSGRVRDAISEIV